MTRSLFHALVAAAFVSTVPAVPADARRTTITPLDNARFEVAAGRPGAGGSSFWCGASSYVVKTLRRSWQTEITIERGRSGASQTQRESVLFTLDPAAAGIATREVGQINALAVGDTMSAQRAYTYCHQGGAGSSR